MRYVSISILVLLLIFQSVGNQVLFHAQRQQIRKEMKRQLKVSVKQEKLVVFKTVKQGQNPKMHWQNKHEFRFENMFYDVVQTESRGKDSLWLYCVSDAQEERLFAGIDALVGKEWRNPAKQNQREKTSLALSSTYLPAKIIELQACSFSHSKNDFNYLFSISNWGEDPAGPPPKYFFI